MGDTLFQGVKQLEPKELKAKDSFAAACTGKTVNGDIPTKNVDSNPTITNLNVERDLIKRILKLVLTFQDKAELPKHDNIVSRLKV